MKSIRFFLISVILSTITLVIFVAALNGYRSSMEKAEQLFDSILIDKADILSMIFSVQHPDVEKTGYNFSTVDLYVFQVWQGTRLLSHSINSPHTPISQFEPGFQDRNFLNHRWRIYSAYNQSRDVWIFTGERIDIRSSLAENIILETVEPVIIMIPFLGILIWYIINYGFSPLTKLAADLSVKRSNDFSPLSTKNQPVELIQVVNSTNGLLARLKSTFLRENRFTSDAAHELRTPISAIKVHLYNLSKVITADEHSFIQLKSAVDRMGHLVEQILNLNRTAPEYYASQFSKTNLFELAKEVIIREYPSFEKKKLQLELKGGPCYLHGEPFALDILIQNLLSNACKYTPEDGTVIVSVNCNKQSVRLKIEDSGPGIPEEQYDRLFDRFYRLDGDCHKSETVGCGLGLAIVKQIAELHHASIKLAQSSLAGGGLQVNVIFPKEQK